MFSKTFIHEFLLKTVPHIERILGIRIEMARSLYNAILKEALIRASLMKQSKLWTKAKNEKSQERKKLFQEARNFYQFSDYSLQKFAISVKNSCDIGKHLDTHTCQKIATRAFNAVDQYVKGIKGKPRFKRKGWLSSLEGKSNEAGIRFRGKNLCWKGLEIPIVFNKKDPDLVELHALNSKIKYCRLIQKTIKEKTCYFVQLILEGTPFIKPKNTIKKEIIGLDLGPSSIAVFSKEEASLQAFCPELDPLFKEIRLLQRTMDRSQRAMNPENYENGKIKKDRLEWKKSKRYQKCKKIIAEIFRKTAVFRKRLHGKLVNEILKHGNHIKIEKLSYRGWQKMYGKSVGKKAPSLFVNILRRKVENTGGSFEEVSTQKTHLSQTCHQCGKREKKPLSKRWHKCCDVVAQRDLYSAFLVFHVKDNILDISQAKIDWPSAHPLLEQAMSRLNQTTTGKARLASFGFAQNKTYECSPSQSCSLAKDRSDINKAKDGVGSFPRALESLCSCC